MGTGRAKVPTGKPVTAGKPVAAGRPVATDKPVSARWKKNVARPLHRTTST